ncbi:MULTISPECIES: PCYCGC motif-containing (lipo)protein [Caballeronia]|nr:MULTISPECIES: PCYCGC motif-containing (lipo)protein [Caballeronia]MCE4547756.1 PCYCGC domain-containing protein [Caballeronia sp. PC1]MCE4575690.1 PCYCGC domain-containing protein [Caballeronia sp. CLC5]
MKRDTPEKNPWGKPSRKARLHLLFLSALVLAIPAAMVWGPSLMRHETTSVAMVAGPSSQVRQGTAAVPWHIGMLRPDGLRIIPSGRSDASHVLSPNKFVAKDVRHAYWVATQIPAVLNKLYCWCGCENRGVHRSNLQCFEDEMAVTCAVCQGTAEIAYQMTQDGVQDAGKIQAGVDAKWAPRG